MLKPAQMYEDQLRQAMMDCWYDPKYMYYNGWTGNEVLELPANNYDRHDFVSVDCNGNVIGYISYNICWATMSASGFGAINFDIGNLIFGRDLLTAIRNLFEVYYLNRIQWSVIEGNPIEGTYRKLAKKYGGTICSHTHQVAKLMDGKLHDNIEFEIMAENYFKARA